MAYRLLDPTEIQRELYTLQGWVLSEDGVSISRSFAFRNFIEAFGFMARCALLSEKLNHHPDWSNSYSNVQVRLTTHVKQALTDRDFALARGMDEAFRGSD